MHIDRILDGGGGGGLTKCFNNLINQNPNFAIFVSTPLAEQRIFKELSGKNVQKIPQPPRHPLYRKMVTLRKCN